MMPLIDEHRPKLAAACRRFHVKSLELFGSAADGNFDPVRSDLDFLVEFLADPAARPFDDFFGLLEELEALFGRKVDLVMPSAIRNPYLQKAVQRQRMPLFTA